MKRILLLDLENTTIPAWGSFTPLEFNCRKLQRYIEILRYRDVRIFSWVLWDENDKQFWKEHKVALDECLGVTVNDEDTLTIQQYMELLREHNNQPDLTQQQFFDQYDKESILFTLAFRGYFDGYHVTLIDDNVQNCKFQFPNCYIEVLNVDDILLQ